MSLKVLCFVWELLTPSVGYWYLPNINMRTGAKPWASQYIDINPIPVIHEVWLQWTVWEVDVPLSAPWLVAVSLGSSRSGTCQQHLHSAFALVQCLMWWIPQCGRPPRCTERREKDEWLTWLGDGEVKAKEFIVIVPHVTATPLVQCHAHDIPLCLGRLNQL